MQKVFLGLLLFGMLASCNKQSGTPSITVNEKPDTAAVVVNQANTGTFVSNGEGVMGMVKLYLADGKYSVGLENFKTNNGPDLHVYLSKEIQPVNFIDLGRLKATTGNQVYAVPGTPDFKLYKYVLIHCQQYNHLFGSAEIVK